MTEIFKKYASGVYCIQSESDTLSHGDIITVSTKYGKEVSCLIWKKLFSKNGVTYYSYVREDGFNRTEWMRKKAERSANASARQKRLSNEYWEKSNKDRDFLVLGEPIKIGHHSERRHRKAIENAQKFTAKSFHADDKAKDYAYKSESLDYMADKQINLDNPESIEKLADRVQDLIETKETLKASGNYQSYQLRNLNGNIKRYRDRLEIAKKLWDVDYVPEPKENKETKQERVNKILDQFGVIWAFSNEQFEIRKEKGLEYVSIGAGGFCPSDKIDDMLKALKAA